MPNIACPLCGNLQTSLFFCDRWREYRRCSVCRLIHVPSKFHLSRSDERIEYDLHQNSPDDLGYRRFLSRLFDLVQTNVSAASVGLDFGSGPGPTLSVMLQEAGHSMAIYDPFYSTDTMPLDSEYDFVTASEVVEHFCRPRTDLDRMWACVRPGGLLGIMTKLALDRAAFAKWHYKNDRTHVSFYSRETFEWLAAQWNANLEFHGNDVIGLTRAV